MQITSCIQRFGETSLSHLATTALRGSADPEALSHALRWVGRLRDDETFHGRLPRLTRTPEAPSEIVRDGAGLGLVEFGSPAALPVIKAAIVREPNRSLETI